MRASLLALVSLVSLSALTGVAAADDQFHPVPGAPGLELRVVAYGRGVHGEMTVELHNRGGAAATFVASGLYFLPDDDGGDAPQRLAMVGGIRAGSEDAPVDSVAVAAGGTRKLRFDVFCIDENRHAPPLDQAFTLAAQRLPVRVNREIVARTKHVFSGVELRPTAEQESMVQSLVWEARRQVRTRLLGDRR